MSDLISRQEAIDALWSINSSEDRIFVDAIVDMLENLPSKYCPCCETMIRQPEDNNKQERMPLVIKHYVNIEIQKAQMVECLCGNCRNKVLEGDEYCSHCGNKLNWGYDE